MLLTPCILFCFTVDLHNCLHPNVAVSGTTNPNFVVQHEGSVYTLYAKEHIQMSKRHLSFGIILQDNSSKKEKLIPVTLVSETRVSDVFLLHYIFFF